MCVHEHMCVHMHLHVCAHEPLCVLFQCPAEVLMVTTLARSALRVGTGARVGTAGTRVIPLGTGWKDIVFVLRCRLQVGQGCLCFSLPTQD